MNEKLVYVELGILALLLISMAGFFGYIYTNLEEFKNMQNYQQFCGDQGYIYIDLNAYNHLN